MLVVELEIVGRQIALALVDEAVAGEVDQHAVVVLARREGSQASISRRMAGQRGLARR